MGDPHVFLISCLGTKVEGCLHDNLDFLGEGPATEVFGSFPLPISYSVSTCRLAREGVLFRSALWVVGSLTLALTVTALLLGRSLARLEFLSRPSKDLAQLDWQVIPVPSGF